MAKASRLKAPSSSKEQVSAKDEQTARETQDGLVIGGNDRPVIGTRSRKRALADGDLAARPTKMPALEIAKRISEVQATADLVSASRGRGRSRIGCSRGRVRGNGRVSTLSNAIPKSASKFLSQSGWRRMGKSRVRSEAIHRKGRKGSSRKHLQLDASRGQSPFQADSSLAPITRSYESQATEDCRDKAAGVQRNRSSNALAKKSSSLGKVETLVEGEDSMLQHKRRNKSRKRRPPVDDLLRIKRRVRNLLVRLRQEQHLLDAYSSEGWKGQSREKLRPERELQRAENKILSCKFGIRDGIRELDVLCLEGSIDQSAFDAEGQIYHEEIFCAKCKSQDALPDNDIILCDGFCNRGFHQNCLQPPLATEDIPPGDEGWLCPACEAKLDCVNHINAYMGTLFEVETGWEEMFAEEAASVAGEGAGDAALANWPSEDEEDDDFDPERAEKELSEDNEEEADEGSEPSSDESSGSGSEGDEDAASCDKSDDSVGSDGAAEVLNEVSSCDKLDDKEDIELPAGRRSRKTVDYKRLNDEMFGGKTELDEDQEEWQSEDEGRGSRKGRRARKAGNSDKKVGVGGGLNASPSSKGRTSKGDDDPEQEGVEGRPQSSCQEKRKRIVVRLPAGAIEIMRGEFAKNELPTREFKDELAKQLGLCYRQVDQWFKNMRYHAIKNGLSTSSRPRIGESSSKGPGRGTEVSRPVPVVESSAPLGESRRKTSLAGSSDGQLLERLDEVELKLQELKRSLDLEEDGKHDSSTKRIVYVPAAEVVEKDS